MTQQTLGHARSDIKRSEFVLDRIVGRGELTSAGKEWLIAAFDPFHDRDLDCTGYPDTTNSNSMLQCLTMTAQISAPASIVTAGVGWDCHFVDWPFLGPAGVKPSSSTYTATAQVNAPVVYGMFNETGSGGVINTFGGLGIYVSATSTNNSSPFTGTIVQQSSLSPTGSDLKDPYRIVGKAFEVYNTTAELYKSGAVCVYNQAVPDFNVAATANFINNTGIPSFGAASCNLMDAPPQNVTEAMRIPTTRQWDAKEGCYVIAKKHKCDLPVHLGNWCQPMYYENLPSDVTMYGPSTGSIPFITGTVPLNIRLPVDYNWANFDQEGAIFTGLTPQSTLTVNYRLFVEVFPTSSSALANYAHPSPEYDPLALKLYDEISHRAPIGVEVKFNGLGDWFINAVNTVADAAMPILKKMPHPAAQGLAGVLGGVKKMTGNTMVQGKNAPKAPGISEEMRNARNAAGDLVYGTKKEKAKKKNKKKK